MFKEIWSFLKLSFSEFNNDKVSKLAAALAYYAIFSIAPVFIIAIAIAGFVFGQQAAQGQIVGKIEGVVGPQGAQVIQSMIAGASKPSSGIVAAALSVLALLFGASGVFVQLQDAMNMIWEVKRKPGAGIVETIKSRLFAVVMVISVGVLVIALMVGSSVMWALTSYFRDALPLPGWFWQGINFLVNLTLLTLVFGLILKMVPDVKAAWKDVWVGAAATAFLFTIGQLLIGLYLGRGSFSSTYGVAGAVLLLLVWIYYSAQIFLFGAEMTQVYARRYGKKIEPADNAISIREEPGMPDQRKKAA